MWFSASALLVYLAGGMLSQYGGRAAPILRDAVTWLALGLGLVTIYTYRDTLLPMVGRVAGELIPGSAMTVEAEQQWRDRGDACASAWTVTLSRASR